MEYEISLDCNEDSISDYIGIELINLNIDSYFDFEENIYNLSTLLKLDDVLNFLKANDFMISIEEDKTLIKILN